MDMPQEKDARAQHRPEKSSKVCFSVICFLLFVRQAVVSARINDLKLLNLMIDLIWRYGSTNLNSEDPGQKPSWRTEKPVNWSQI